MEDQQMKYCRMCGKQIRVDVKFCRYCGYEFKNVVEKKPEPPKVVARICKKCGNQVSQTATFCRHCGSKMETMDIPVEQSMGTAAIPIARSVTTAPVMQSTARTQNQARSVTRELGNVASKFAAPAGTGEFALDAMPSNLVEVAKRIATPRVETVVEYLPGKSFFGKIMKLVSVVSSFGAVYLGVQSKSLPVIGGTVIALFLSGILSKTKKVRK